MKIRWFLRVPLFIALALLAASALGLIVMLLWNALIPALFGGPALTFWQAVGLLLLSKILFHGFGGGGHRHHRHHSWKKERLKRKMQSMTPEQRERFCHRWEQLFGTEGLDDEQQKTTE